MAQEKSKTEKVIKVKIFKGIPIIQRYLHKSTKQHKVIFTIITENAKNLRLKELSMAKEKCSICNGEGNLKCDECWGDCHIDCEDCGGVGEKPEGVKCGHCDGAGQIPCPSCEGQGTTVCFKCNGTGNIWS